MTKTSRTRTPSADMEAALLEAAADILENEGPDGLSVRRNRRGGGGGADGRLQPLRVEVRDRRSALHPGFPAPLRRAGCVADVQDPSEALREGGLRYRALALAHPMVYQLNVPHVIPGSSQRARLGDRWGGVSPNLVATVQRAMTAGVIADGSPTDTAHMNLGEHPRWVSARAHGHRLRRGPGAGFDRVCQTILVGLRPDADVDAPSGAAAKSGAT